jgi:N-methylhydantoinase A
MGYFCGVDIGGTFTDCVAIDDDGAITLAKSPSTPPEFAQGFVNAVAAAGRRLGLELPEFLSQTELLLHGTTVGTNIFVQMSGARTGLITTRGHRDALLIMRSFGRSAGLPIERLLHTSRHRKPDPIVPPELIKEVSERVDWQGDVVLPLHRDEASRAVDDLLNRGVESIVISFLWGFANPAHELAVKRMVRQRNPDVFVTCAHELIAKPGEYERTAGAVINGFIGPSTSDYLMTVSRTIADQGYRGQLLIMQASGGAVPVEAAIEKPLFTIGSGPVGGIAGAAYLARLSGDDNVIGVDMGGTSFDVGIIADSSVLTASETVINQYTFFMPRVDIESIGAGGGSIVWLDDDSGTMRVGPESAGARPGPACYGVGGTRPTITDCNVIVGRYPAGVQISGGLTLDGQAAHRAMEPIAVRLGMTVSAAAAAAIHIVESHMADLMRQMTVERGLDPRDFVVYSFGGAGGAHAAALTRQLGAREVVVPLGQLAGTWSALGVMTADVLHVHEHAELLAAPFDAATLNEILAGLEDEARAQLHAEGFADNDIELERSADMRFSLQVHQLEVSVPAGALTERDAHEQVESFIRKYEDTFGAGSAFPGAGTQMGLLRVTARGRNRTPKLPEVSPGEARPESRRDVYWRETGGSALTDIYRSDAIRVGAALPGPAVVELPETTVVIPPSALARVDRFGSIRIDVQERTVDGE